MKQAKSKGLCPMHYRRVHPQKSSYKSRLYYRDRDRAIQFLGGKCVRCGFSDHRALQIDHKKGRVKEPRQDMTCTKLYADVLINSHKYQILCANCNWIKRHEEREVPGPRTRKVLED